MCELKEKLQEEIKRLNSLTIAEDYLHIEINLKKQEIRKSMNEYINSTMAEKEILYYYGRKFIYLQNVEGHGKIILEGEDGKWVLQDIEDFYGELNSNVMVRQGDLYKDLVEDVKEENKQ